MNRILWCLKRHGLAEFGIQEDSEIALPDVGLEDEQDVDDNEFAREIIVRVVETNTHIVEQLLVFLY